MADALTDILRAASKHPNSRVSKLIHTVEEEPSQKNIVLLLIELAEHAEYSTDFNVSLKYYLDYFERLGISSDLVLNEAGLLLVNSSKIYSKRVDYVQSLVERQILTLSNADEELQKQKLEQQQTENAAPTEKPKRGRKRVLEAPSDPYEVELTPKKFKKLTEEKRFAVPKSAQKPKSLLRNIEMEQQIHPAGWQHATIYDLENEEDIDTKRNYKLFTYHIEHRYNTLVPDINFRLHFKMKDYMDEQEEMEDEACNTDRSWPPLSEAYVQKYLRLENYVLQQDMKAKKRKSAELDEDTVSPAEGQTVITNDPKDPADNLQEHDSINVKNVSELDQTMLDCSAANNSTNEDLDPANKSQENLDSSNINGKNDSGLGQSILDETNNILETTQLDATNLNDTNTAEANKENDSALGTSVLDQTSSTENNTTAEAENLNDTNVAEANNSLNTTENQQENDSALGTSVLDQSNDATTDTTKNLDITTNSESLNDTNVEAEANKSLNNSETQLENDSALGTSVLDQTSNTENNTTTEANENLDTTQEGIAETSGVLETSSTENNTTEANENLETIKEGDENKTDNPAELSKATDNRKDSALIDDRHHSISTENLAMSRENLNQIDVEPQLDKDNNQIRIELPHTDDEGVYLSDLEDNECRLLSPVIKAANILPGVERKDVTIYMDDELKEALEMRDDIMEHFSYETFKVPVITTPKKQNLLFNIFKLPEKLVRRKILFKLGPEMDLYLQARSLKRCRNEAPARVVRTPQLTQWFSLNDTDMSGVCMSPPYSPGHSSDFCGFSDNEDDDDSDSCAEFCGFTEEEQETLIIKHVCRLSRDSGVGVDVNNLTPEKETLEIIFEEVETSAVENCKRIINLDETPNNCEQSTESLLNQLPDEIREVLTTELEGNNETPENGNKEPNTEASCSETIEESEKLQTQSSMDNSECVTTENSATNNTQESDMVLTENSTETQICTEGSAQSTESQDCTEESALSTEPLTNTQDSNMVLTENSTETPACSAECPESTEPESQQKATDVCGNEIPKDSDIETPCDKSSKSDESKKSAEELLKEKLDLANNSMAECDNDDIMENDDDSDDDEMLNLETQGIKTKIQQWHEHLQPILAKSRERHHFDVFKLGSEIIETVQTVTDSNEESANVSKSSSTSSNRPAASFHDIMDSKDNSYVSRYFLSTLLLANQSNIEISIDNKSSEKPSSWHDIHLKLLSTKRHTVAIEDNIGMIDNKQKASDNKAKLKTKEKPIMGKIQEVVDEEEDEPLIKLQSSKKATKKSKTSLKRNSDNAITSLIAEKKPKEITTTTPAISRHNELPHLIEDVQIITPPAAVSDINMMPCTSRQAQYINTALFNVNINKIQTLQPIEKVQKRSDDHDSGIFSIDEMTTS
ncbi:uncharacterized protein Cap-H2 [Calliphora vicina]|uniref:uncharacterized protein Cap-H2 n=1 Tax=Calliphora vicina TaxID=7373 RepID=UPI00325ADBB7